MVFMGTFVQFIVRHGKVIYTHGYGQGVTTGMYLCTHPVGDLKIYEYLVLLTDKLRQEWLQNSKYIYENKNSRSISGINASKFQEY